MSAFGAHVNISDISYWDEYACLSVCLPVCPQGYLRNHTRDLYRIFLCMLRLCPWLGLLRHVDGRAQRGRSVIYYNPVVPEVVLTTLAAFSFYERKLRPMTLTIELDLDSVKFNQQAKYPGRRLFSSNVIVRIHRDRRTPDRLLYGGVVQR